MASRYERNTARTDDEIYTHPYTPASSSPPRRVHFNEHVQYQDVPEWHVTATSSQSTSPALVVIPDTTPPTRPLPLDTPQQHLHSLGQAQDRLARPQPHRGSPPTTQTLPPTQKPRSSQSPPQSQRPTPSPPRAQSLLPHPSTPRRVNTAALVNNVNQPPSPPSPPPASLNTLLRPYGGVAVNFVADPSSTTVTVTDQTASPSAHYSPPRSTNTRERANALSPSTVLLKAYQREQHATSPPLPTMRIVLPPSIGVHHFVANHATPNVGGTGPMIVVVSSRVPGALLTVGELFDVLRAVLMTQVTPLEWDRASPADQRTATEAFYARIEQSPDPEREKSYGVRKLDWCGRESWFGGLELVPEAQGQVEDPTWRLVMRAGPTA